jgi:hypothetical protein
VSDSIRRAFLLQAQFCEALNSPLTAQVLRTLSDTLNDATRTGARILGWPGDPMADALKLRIAGGLNALARSRRDVELTQLYNDNAGHFPTVLKRILIEWDDWLFPWLDSPPQTNEVARSGALWPGLMEIARRFGPEIELLELGSSAGLNLNLDHFGYDLDGVKSGDPACPLQLRPDWHGPPPPSAQVNVVARAGVDQNPLDVLSPEIAERLLAYVWPDQLERLARAEAAIAIARQFPPAVERGDAADWIETRLSWPQAEGVTRVIFHSIVLQYLPREDRERVRTAIAAAGRQATTNRPLAWLYMEFRSKVSTSPELCLQCWPGGEMETLADVHPHGATIHWHG